MHAFQFIVVAKSTLALDISYFDETVKGPWEWDLLRFLTSVVIFCRCNGFRTKEIDRLVLEAIDAYVKRVKESLRAGPLAGWSLTQKDVVKSAKASQELRRKYRSAFTMGESGSPRFLDEPPRTFHPPDTQAFAEYCQQLFESYRCNLPEHQRLLINQLAAWEASEHVQ
jgi:hypothetical protein